MNLLLTLAASLLYAAFSGAAVSSTASSAASSGQPGGDAKAKVELLAPAQAKPGDTIDVGVKFQMDKGWHIYWINPGDSGQAPEFAWGLPGGGASRMMRGGEWKATEPAFPTPDKFDAGGGLVGYGYHDTIVFPATITIPATATPGQNLELSVAVDYLICEEICLPEKAYATTEIELTPAPEDDRQLARELDDAKQRLPKTSSGKANVEDLGEGNYRVEITGVDKAAKADLFVDTPTGVTVTDITAKGDGTTAVFEYNARRFEGSTVRAKTMKAVVGYDTAGGRRGVEIELPVPAEK